MPHLCHGDERIRVANLNTNAFFEDEGKILAAVYFQGCNMDCSWCQNPELKVDEGGIEKTPLEVFEELTKDNFLSDGVLISGGEPMLQDGIVELCRLFVAHGWRVVLNTNGTSPGILAQLPAGMRVTLDVKMPRQRYPVQFATDMDLSLSILRSFDESEVRITYTPSLASDKDVMEMVRWIRSLNKKVQVFIQPYKWNTKMPPLSYIQPTREQVEELMARVLATTGTTTWTRYY
jgi:pyruvate formate lyase activating enzyme